MANTTIESLVHVNEAPALFASRYMIKTIFFMLAWIVFLCSLSCARNAIQIDQPILRNRVVVLDSLEMKKALYVAFTLSGNASGATAREIEGRLLCNGNLIAESSTSMLEGMHGNLVFDLPYEIPDGMYTIQVAVRPQGGNASEEASLVLRKSEFRSTAGRTQTRPVSFREVRAVSEQAGIVPTLQDAATGYMLFSRSPLRYMFPTQLPHSSELISRLSLTMVRNEFEPITFGVYPLRNLGRMQVSVSELKNGKIHIARDLITIGFIHTIPESMGLASGEYRMMPAVIKPGNRAMLREGEVGRFWLTVRSTPRTKPGTYHGSITLTPQFGKKKTIPLAVTVVPIRLEELPDKEYSLLMTYEFTEVVFARTLQEKKRIKQSARAVLKEYKNHGMTTLVFHSPFVFLSRKDGTPVLDDIFAGVDAARDEGFVRPVIWYMGHLIQTAKPQHPGNIRGYEKTIQQNRLITLVKTVSSYVQKNNRPPVVFLPIDEPDDPTADYRGRRRTAVPDLIRTIQEAGGQTMITQQRYDPLHPPDYFCTSRFNADDLITAHGNGSRYWMYDNAVTTTCQNPAYARHRYGIFVWKHGLDGMTSWTFQNTQNAQVMPMKQPGGSDDVYLAYPDPAGPLATLRWEAIRDGIDDHKLLYQLEKRIAALRQKNLSPARYEEFLNRLRQKRGNPVCSFETDREWPADFFHTFRNECIRLILQADTLLASPSKKHDL
ncbi:MAG: glycoside hydrolase domain-containing protein [Nitrospirota bacterium]